MAYQKVFEKKFDRVFSHLKMREEPSQRVFFDGQIYDAFSFLVEFVGKAEQNIALVDGYVDMGTLKGLRVRDVEQPH